MFAVLLVAVMVVLIMSEQRRLKQTVALLDADLQRRLDAEQAAARNGADLRRVREGSLEESLQQE